MSYIKRRITVRKRLSDNTWQSVANEIVLNDATDFKVSKGLGKKVDIIDFRISNANNRLFEKYFNGDGTTTDFDLDYGPVPDEYRSGSTQKVFVYVDDVEQEYGSGNDYTISSSTVSFNSAPASGTRNIKVKFPILEADDLIRVYRWKDTASYTSSDLLDEAMINNPKEDISDTGRNMVIRAESLISIIFHGLVFERPGTGKIYAHQYIQDVISQLNELNQNRKIYGENSTEWAAIENGTTSRIIDYTSSYQSAIEVIEDLSSKEHTNDGNYIFYVTYNPDRDSGIPNVEGTYDFIWKAKPTPISITLTEGTDFTSIKPQKSTDEIINAAIFNCGLGCEGESLEFPYYCDTGGRGGGRWKYITETNTIAEELINNEFTATIATDSSKWDYQGTPPKISKTSNYPNDYTGYTMQFSTRTNWVSTGTKVTPTSDTEFNNAIKDEAEALGRNKVINIIEGFNQPRYKVTVEIPYGADSNTHTLGDIYEITSPSFGLYNKKLRLVQVDYTFWTTDLQLEEDEKTGET